MFDTLLEDRLARVSDLDIGAHKKARLNIALRSDLLVMLSNALLSLVGRVTC